MDQKSSRLRWAVGVAALAVFAIGVWRAQREGPTAPGPGASDAGTTGAAVSPRADPPEAALPTHRIAESGRLSLEADALAGLETLALAFDLPDQARGSEPRPVVIASEDGRSLTTTAAILPGSGTGVYLEIDPRWLEPGRYMVSVSTAEPSHFPVRRYVLEIR